MMIRSRAEYRMYLEADRRALNRTTPRPRYIGDEVWRFQRLLRTVEYVENCRRSWYFRPLRTYLYAKFHRLSMRLGFTIPPNVFGPGLSIAHRGTIVVNGSARVGANCRLHVGVHIGTSAGTESEAPVIGDNVYIGPGAVLYGPITIADSVAIGANSLVNRSFSEPDVTIAGAPARVVSERGTTRFGDTDGAAPVLDVPGEASVRAGRASTSFGPADPIPVTPPETA